MKLAFLYAGQGSQKVGMGIDIYEKFPEYRKLVDQFSLEYYELMKEGPLERLSQTANTQPCMAIFAAGVTDVLKKYGIHPAYAAGLSLGEYGALYAAGVWDVKTYIALTEFRGKQMEASAKGIPFKMTAILKLDRTLLQEACKEASQEGYVTIVNYNCPGQYVIGGDEKAVEIAEKIASSKGAKRCIPLNVSGPFHTKYMHPASEALALQFQQIEWKEPIIPVVSNVTGKLIQNEESIPRLLELQVKSSVFFEDSIQTLLDEGVDTIIEIGPGKVLSGFVKKINPSICCLSIETAQELEQVITVMKEMDNE